MAAPLYAQSNSGEEAQTAPAPKTDEEFLALAKLLRETAVGFEGSSQLLADRKTALEYAKGEMPDLATLPNRSKAVDTVVNDAVETALPDLVEILAAGSVGDDVVSFNPVGPEDEEAAQQETDYINHVFFQENPGFMIVYTMIKDALLQKVGVGYACWEDNRDTTSETFTGKTAVELSLAAADGEVSDVEIVPGRGPNGEELYAFTLSKTQDNSGVMAATVPPEDFTVASDTVELSKTSYCAMKSRPRVQDLIADGVDEDIARSLTPYSQNTTNTAADRDTAGESQTSTDNPANQDMQTVEVVDHYMRVLAKDGKKLELWRVKTGNDETVFIEKAKVNRILFAACTPYPVTHRFYGRSLADLLIEVQKIKTALLRMMLDSGYFALNQRVEIGMDKAGDFTVSDFLNNVPGSPVRSKTAGAIIPIATSGLTFDAFNAMEYMATVAEGRTGVVRNAQGLNPDTLHDTAKGAMALILNAQKRLRLIARIIAETGFKDLMLIIHALIRENATASRKVRLRNQWVDVDPSKWAERNDMTIEIGLGASGREHDLIAMQQIEQTALELGATQYGPLLIKPTNAYNIFATKIKKLGFKNPDEFVTKPPKEDPNAPPAPPPPDPKMAEVQGKLTLQQQDQAHQQQMQIAQAQADQQASQQKQQADMAKAQMDAETQRQRDAAAIQLQREIAAEELQLKREQYAAELDLKRWEIQEELKLKAVGIAADTHVALDRNAQVNVGGEPG